MGFQANAAINATEYFGIVGEFSFYQDTERWEEFSLTGECKWRLMPVVFGPRFSYRGDRVRVFGHYLLGFVNASYLDKDDEGTVWEDISDTNFGQAIGGGIDIAVNDTVSIRPVQFDFLSTRLSYDGESMWNHAIRYSGGIVLKFGNR